MLNFQLVPVLLFFVTSVLPFPNQDLLLRHESSEENQLSFGTLRKNKQISSGHHQILPCNSQAEVQHGETLIIESPNFGEDKPYPKSTECQWKFRSDCPMTMSCSEFQLNDLFCLDYLEVSSNISTSKKFCARNGPKGLSLENNVDVRFSTNIGHNLPGLALGFQCQVSCPAEDFYLEQPNLHTDLRNEDTYDCDCGEVSPEKKIINGVETRINEYLWMTALVRKGDSVPFCGGSLINDRFILTAAHCVKYLEAHQIDVVLAEHNVNLKDDTKSVVRSVDEIIFHPNYTYYNDYDVALLRLKEAVILTTSQDGPQLLNVCLPKGLHIGQTWEGYSATACGWGKNADGTLSPTLQHVNLTVMSNENCKKFYSAPGILWPRMMCASAPSKDTCSGDSGGPLMIQLEGKFTQIGIVSFGASEGCGPASKKPGVYSRVTEVAAWISENSANGRACRHYIQ